MKYPQIEPMDEAAARLDKRCKALEEELAALRKHAGHVQEMLNASRSRQIECQQRERFHVETECRLMEENRRLRTWMGDSIVRSDYRSADHMRATIDGLREAVQVLVDALAGRMEGTEYQPLELDWLAPDAVRKNPIAWAAVQEWIASKSDAEQTPAVDQGGAEEDQQDQREGQHRQI